MVPTVGWQLDPFGHSATQASLLPAEAGFDALYFGDAAQHDEDNESAMPPSRVRESAAREESFGIKFSESDQ